MASDGPSGKRDDRREGAVLYPTERRVRLRHEPVGFVYELREQDDATYDVVHIDTVTGETTPVGTIRRVGVRLTADKTGRRRTDDALRLVARAWSKLPFLKKSSA